MKRADFLRLGVLAPLAGLFGRKAADGMVLHRWRAEVLTGAVAGENGDLWAHHEGFDVLAFDVEEAVARANAEGRGKLKSVFQYPTLDWHNPAWRK